MPKIEYKVPVSYRGYEMVVESDYLDNDVYTLATDVYNALDDIYVRWPYTILLFVMQIGLIFTSFVIFGPTFFPVLIIFACVMYIIPYANMADVEYLTEDYLRSKGYTGVKIYWKKAE